MTLREKKTGEDKRIKLNDAATEAIDFFCSQVKARPSDWLFGSKRTRKPLSRIQAYRLISSCAREVGFRDRIGTHSLRKSWGYQARKSGTALELIQARVGHSSPGVTWPCIGITVDEIENVENHVKISVPVLRASLRRMHSDERSRAFLTRRQPSLFRLDL